ncbi:hypothetical protein [Niabella hibiscisoli]|uniref:hypothetical protein n=1 Tax=Niabella hibiscisoli TaxID=1825928 RepID=UPI001F109D12|nr:hypothetical protein [Niabella hibiscisoli]MCH5720090.1 hypothetical protein [Niabella hibiscisoli]
MKPIFVTILLSIILLGGCINNDKSTRQRSTGAIVTDTVSLQKDTDILRLTDSLDLLALTRKLLQWSEEESKQADFEPRLANTTDTVYAGIDFNAHHQRLKELAQTGIFTHSFKVNYNKIALAIDKEVKNRALIWETGALPPFGNGANPWCNCQDTPDNYPAKIWIMHLSFKNDTASYNWSWGDGLVYHMKALREDGKWKIDYMEGFDYDGYIRSFVYVNQIKGSWENDLVRVDIGDETLTLWYHGQCVYFYPIRTIDSQTVEMIWARDMDCKFDNGTNQKFGLKQVPVQGQPFAKFTLRDNILYAHYYYDEWVRQYSKQVQSEVFTPSYSRRLEHY